MKANENAVIAPISVPPMQASMITVRFLLAEGSPTPWGLRMVSKGGAATKAPLKPAPITVEKASIMLILETVGPNYGRQRAKIPVGILHLKDWRWTSLGTPPTVYELKQVRTAPPLFRSLWNSLFN